MSDFLIAASSVAAALYLVGTAITYFIGLSEWSLAAELLKKVNDGRYPNLEDEFRAEARRDLENARRWIRKPYLWPAYLASNAAELRAAVIKDQEATR